MAPGLVYVCCHHRDAPDDNCLGSSGPHEPASITFGDSAQRKIWVNLEYANNLCFPAVWERPRSRL